LVGHGIDQLQFLWLRTDQSVNQTLFILWKKQEELFAPLLLNGCCRRENDRWGRKVPNEFYPQDGLSRTRWSDNMKLVLLLANLIGDGLQFL